MKIFQTFQKQFAILGISPDPNHSNRKYIFNEKLIFGFLLLGYMIVSQFVYIFYEANGFMEYVESICATSASTIVLACLANTVFRRALIFESIDNMETLIDTSRSFFKDLYYS